MIFDYRILIDGDVVWQEHILGDYAKCKARDVKLENPASDVKLQYLESECPLKWVDVVYEFDFRWSGQKVNTPEQIDE